MCVYMYVWHKCVNVDVCMYTHVHVEARDRCQVSALSPSILIWRQALSLNPELTN